jgi:hypothetical protein
MRQDLDIGIVMLTGAIDLVDRVVGLEMGADDYVTKPFSLSEIAARIDAILRRRRMSRHQLEPFGPVLARSQALGAARRRRREDPAVPDRDRPCRRLRHQSGQADEPDELLRLAPGNASDPIDRSIDKRVERLRRKLEKHGLGLDLIETVRSDGYIYKGPGGACLRADQPSLNPDAAFWHEFGIPLRACQNRDTSVSQGRGCRICAFGGFEYSEWTSNRPSTMTTIRKLATAAMATGALIALAGCSGGLDALDPSTEITPKLAREIKAKGFNQEDAVLVRIFKEES